MCGRADTIFVPNASENLTILKWWEDECKGFGFYFLGVLFMAAPVAYQSSQARDWIQATVATYTTPAAITGSFNPLSQAGDTCLHRYPSHWSQIFFFFFFCFLGPHLQHMKVIRLRVELELQLPAYTTAMWDPRCIFDLHHRSQQCQIPNPLSKARDQTCILRDASHIRFHCATVGTPQGQILNPLCHSSRVGLLNRIWTISEKWQYNSSYFVSLCLKFFSAWYNLFHVLIVQT